MIAALAVWLSASILTAEQDHIIQCLGLDKWDTEAPEIYFPLRPGTLKQLAQDANRGCDAESLCLQTLEQMLMALDCLAHHNLCHRDVKPDNILYYPKKAGGQYHFELADFGLVNLPQWATTICGTPFYQAPELFRKDINLAQSTKMDIWSLFATLMDVHPLSNFPPPDARDYSSVLEAIRSAAAGCPMFADMAREDPIYQPSAAQLLVKHFNGRGRTTRGSVPPIPELPKYPVEMEGVVMSTPTPVSTPVQPPNVNVPVSPPPPPLVIPRGRLLRPTRNEGSPALETLNLASKSPSDERQARDGMQS